jgi:putative ABC transport system substrate-binding protein
MRIIKGHFLRHVFLYHCRLVVLLLIAACLCGGHEARSAEVLVVGDTRLKPVVEVVAGIQETMGRQVTFYAPSEVKAGKLSGIVRKEGARTVIALGQESISEALQLPTSVTVLYALVILPPQINRPNTAGMYMGTPIKEYLDLVASFLPSLKNICVIATPEVLEVLDKSNQPHLTAYQARNAYDFVDTIKGLDAADALLLLPDISLLTKTAIEESYLFSFRKKVPLLGISKKYVRQGALFALEFDPRQVGRRLGRMAAASLLGKGIAHNQALPAQHFNLYINRETAKKMGIIIPAEMLAHAKSVYP